MLLLLSVGKFVTVIVNAESNTQDCLSTNWNDLILEAALCNVWDVLIMSLRAMQGHTQTWSSLVKYKFVLVCRSGPWLVLSNLIRENNLKGDIFLKITFHARITVYIWPTVIDQVSSSDFFHWKDLMLKENLLNLSHDHWFQGSHFTSVDFDFMNINQLTRETQWGRIQSRWSEGYYPIVKVPTLPHASGDVRQAEEEGGRVTSEREVD